MRRVYRESVNTPDFPPSEWIINPDISALRGVDEKYWKADGDRVVAMSQSEKDAVDLAELTAAKQARQDAFDADVLLKTVILEMLAVLREVRGGSPVPSDVEFHNRVLARLGV